MNKKAIVGDATIIAISLIIIATLGIASFVMFGTDVFGEDVEQIIKESEYGGEINDILFNLLKQDADYEGLNNLGLILLNLDDKIDFNFVNNKLDSVLGIKDCWILQVEDKDKIIVRFKNSACDSSVRIRNLIQYSNWAGAVVSIPNPEKKLSLFFGVVK